MSTNPGWANKNPSEQGRITMKNYDDEVAAKPHSHGLGFVAPHLYRDISPHIIALAEDQLAKGLEAKHVMAIPLTKEEVHKLQEFHSKVADLRVCTLFISNIDIAITNDSAHVLLEVAFENK